MGETPDDHALTDDQLDASASGIVGVLERVARIPDRDWPRPGRVRQLEEELALRRHQPFKTLVRDASERHR